MKNLENLIWNDKELLKALESIENLSSKIIHATTGMETNGLLVMEQARWIIDQSHRCQEYIKNERDGAAAGIKKT